MTSRPDSPVQLTVELSPADLPRIDLTRSCPVCSVEAPSSDVFCQTCGLQLTNDRNHYSEQPGRWLAAATDRGRRHHRNEDASAIEGDETAGFAIMVVCDGVSSAEDTDLASLVGARAARDRLRSLGPTSGGSSLSAADRARTISVALTAAVETAHQAVLRQTDPSSSASSTLAAAVVDAELVGWASVGDSRIYWLPDQDTAAGHTPTSEARQLHAATTPLLLSHDDSIPERRIAAGVPRREAESGPQAHAITNWIGHQAPGSAAEIGVFAPESSGWLVVCSDGFWNYASDPQTIRELVDRLTSGLRPGALALADALLRWACDQGGSDNVTVALARLPLSGSPFE